MLIVLNLFEPGFITILSSLFSFIQLTVVPALPSMRESARPACPLAMTASSLTTSAPHFSPHKLGTYVKLVCVKNNSVTTLLAITTWNYYIMGLVVNWHSIVYIIF